MKLYHWFWAIAFIAVFLFLAREFPVVTACVTWLLVMWCAPGIGHVVAYRMTYGHWKRWE